MSMQGVEYRVQHRRADVQTTFQAVITVDEYLRLDDGHEALLLTNRGVTRQHLGIRLDSQAAGILRAYGIDLTPLGETRPLRLIAAQALGQTVQALGDEVPGGVGQGNLALVHLDAGHDALTFQNFRQRRTVIGLLLQRLFEQDDGGDEFAYAGCGEQQAAIGTTVFDGGFDIDRLKALGDGRRAFIGGEDTLTRLHHCRYGLLQFIFDVHTGPPI